MIWYIPFSAHSRHLSCFRSIWSKHRFDIAKTLDKNLKIKNKEQHILSSNQCFICFELNSLNFYQDIESIECWIRGVSVEFAIGGISPSSCLMEKKSGAWGLKKMLIVCHTLNSWNYFKFVFWLLATKYTKIWPFFDKFFTGT